MRYPKARTAGRPKSGSANRVYLYRNCQGGVFTARVGSVALEYYRDEDAAQLLAEKAVDLTFIGEDKLREWQLAGQVSNESLVDTIPIDCRMVLAGAARNAWRIPRQLGMGELLTVATSYPCLLDEFAAPRGLNLRTMYTPRGGVEAFAASGRTDLVFDITQSGETLRANELVVYRRGEQLCLNVLDQLDWQDPEADPLVQQLEQVTATYLDRLQQARGEAAAPSPTVELLRDRNKLVKKFGEESAEFLQAVLRREPRKAEIRAEAADLLYPLGLFLASNGLSIVDVLAEDVQRNTAQNEL